MYDRLLDSTGFVLLTNIVPQAVLEIRYYSTFNFTGERIDGYEAPVAYLTLEAARALKAVSNDLIVMGYRLKIFDAYRPDIAVKNFIYWGLEDSDTRMKDYFYPTMEKQELFEKGYIATRSSHSRGSTIDLTLIDMKKGKEVDMGSPFDLFHEISHPDSRLVTDEQYENRMLLRNAMLRHGFEPFDMEWWHFTLKNEPFPDTYFNFPITLNL